MVRVVRSARIEAPVTRVWAIVADVEGWPRWTCAPYASESVAWEPPGGSTFVLKGRSPYKLTARVTERAEPRSFRFEFTASEYPSDRLFLARAEAGFHLEAVDAESTVVTYEHSAEGRGLLGRAYMATIFRLFLMRNASRIVAGLRRAATP